ncbi:hypothetical protein Syun_023484 [Stephania yunnanensis]|uniref:Two-component response regulator-like APRR1 n=1 Tax=Stephania yunnanensis TaxID=152371 RepID=A0AAP0HZM5_9MAGN
MESMEIGGGGNSVPFLDRSKVRILLCDNNVKSSAEVLDLLCKCSYQVTSVRTPRQVIDALNAEGPDIDIVLSEVDLPMAKGFKMLKYITRDVELRRIPIIMMSAKDEVSVVVKCLRLGAADYLVKPLRTNELLNLWTHMWRRRRMLGLGEKNILNCDLDLVLSDPSDANTNSTTLFSDDTDDKSKRSTIPEVSVSNNREDEAYAVPSEPVRTNGGDQLIDAPRPVERSGQFSSRPKKSELKIGESSAFFTYVKSSTTQIKSQRISCIDENAAKSDLSMIEENVSPLSKQADADTQRQETRDLWENYYHRSEFSGSEVGSDPSLNRSYAQVEFSFHQERSTREDQFPTAPPHQNNEIQVTVTGIREQANIPYYFSGMMNQVMMPSSAKLYPGNVSDMPNHGISSMLPQYGSVPHGSLHVPVMTSFPYYPLQYCMQPGQSPGTQVWSSIPGSSSTEVKPARVERREAALIKFRQKRKDRCFDKKIRYINRKRLAERRPRVRGQFVRQMGGVNVDLNGQPTAAEDFDEDEEEEEEEELISRDSSPEGDAS